jgi:hypothetical protein
MLAQQLHRHVDVAVLAQELACNLVRLYLALESAKALGTDWARPHDCVRCCLRSNTSGALVVSRVADTRLTQASA